MSLASHLSVLGVSLASQMFGSRQTWKWRESFRNRAPIGAEFLSYKVLVQTSVKAIGELPEETEYLFQEFQKRERIHFGRTSSTFLSELLSVHPSHALRLGGSDELFKHRLDQRCQRFRVC